MRGRKPEAIMSGTGTVDAVPKPPAWLSKDAKAEWRRVAPIIITDRKTLTLADLASFASYCCAVGEIMEASRIISREGMTYQGNSGPKKHPAVSIRTNAMTQARLFAAELGLTPVSRSRPSIRNDSHEDQDASDLGL